MKVISILSIVKNLSGNRKVCGSLEDKTLGVKNDSLIIHLKRDEWTDTAPLTELSNAMAFISTLSKNLGLNHTTEV